MRVLLVSWGTRGDFQPFIALAKRLVASGHEATLAGLSYADAWVAAQGIDFVPVGPPGGDPDELTRAIERLSAWGGRWGGLGALATVRALVGDFLAPGIPRTLSDLLPLAAAHDVVVSHHVQPAGMMAAERAARPLATVLLAPQALSSRYRAPAGFPSRGPLNPVLWKLADVATRAFVERPLRRARATLGFPPLPGGFFLEGSYSRRLNLIAVSRHVYPPPPDLAARHVVTGYWFDEPAGYAPDPALAAFLAAGPPPVLMTFGSMVTTDPRGALRLLADAARRAGTRAVIQAGHERPGAVVADVGAHALVIGDAPHGWLMPRMAAVVHHGGAGTTAAALRAGVPMVVVAHLADQMAWGHTIHRLGAAAPPMARRGLEAGALGRRLAKLLADRGARETAARLGTAIRAEDGTGAAVAAIEQRMAAAPAL